ncbi:MAG: hypothetical protein NVSMB29_19490 [Candidatus Dormibacteria bacterium]
MFHPIRRSVAFKLLAAGLLLAVVIIGGISTTLLISSGRQAKAAAQSTADNRAAVVRQLLQRQTGVQSAAAANTLAAQPALVAAFQADRSGAGVRALFADTTPLELPSEVTLVTSASGTPLYTHAATDLGAADTPSIPPELASIRSALAGQSAVGVEELGGILSYDVATPVRAGATGPVLGVVAYLAPLGPQLTRLATVIGYPVAAIPTSQPGRLARYSDSATRQGGPPQAISSGVAAKAPLVDAVYSAPVGEVAGSFVPVAAVGGRQFGAYVGVETPLAAFAGDRRADEASLGLLTILALALTSMGVIAFVDDVVLRPIRRLERAVKHIADGDYETEVPVSSKDEIGRLGESVDRMRLRISQTVGDLEDARGRLDSGVERLGEVSRALTTTTAGVAGLQRAVVQAVAAIAGDGGTALLMARDGSRLSVEVAEGPGAEEPFVPWLATGPLLRGQSILREVGIEGWGKGRLVAEPMFYQGEVAGALALVTRATLERAADDAELLRVLANNAAVALQNTRLFEQERETVRRLGELDAMKSNFLGVVQHELRTPLTAILGHAELMELLWHAWDDEKKLNAVHDVQYSARSLYDIVETIIDFSLLESDTLDLNCSNVPLRPAIDAALATVAERIRGGMPLPVRVDGLPEVSVYADKTRLDQVLRALIDNAVKFSPGGGSIRIAYDHDRHQNTVTLTITDSGVGIPAEHLPRVFDRFYQVDDTPTRYYGGTGMGLALVDRLVRAHGATVSIRSIVGKGTRVTLVWPATADAAFTELSGTPASQPTGRTNVHERGRVQ